MDTQEARITGTVEKVIPSKNPGRVNVLIQQTEYSREKFWASTARTNKDGSARKVVALVEALAGTDEIRDWALDSARIDGKYVYFVRWGFTVE